MTDLTSKKTCPDCGGAPTNHFLERLDAYVGVYFFSLFRPLNGLNSRFSLLLSRLKFLMPPLIKLLCKLKIARLLNEPDAKTVYRARCLWEEADKMGITMLEIRLFGLYQDSFWAERGKKYCFFQGLPKLPGRESPALSWMDNKGEMKKRFQKLGVPVAKGVATSKISEALICFEQLSKPVIVKPNTGSRSRHTTIHLHNPEELRRAFDKAKQICPWVVVEEELRGSVYRGTVIGGAVIGVLRRDPAALEGDGQKTIKELCEAENKNPLRQGPLFHQLPVVGDQAAEAELKYQNLWWEAVPAAGQIVALGVKTSRSAGGGLVDVTEITHPDITDLLKYIAKILDYPYVGVDFIIADIKKSWQDQDKGGIIECNSLPFIDLHHYPSRGKPRNAAGALWRIIFPDTNFPASTTPLKDV